MASALQGHGTAAMAGVFLFASLAASSCRPDFGGRESLVEGATVLAVRADPPEAAPQEATTFTLLVASKEGTVRAPTVSWSFCATPKLLTENGAVSAECLGDSVVPIGVSSDVVTAAVPENACFVFGPETSGKDLRPRDADVTGGYFQPLRARVERDEGAIVAFGFARIACNLANASADATAEFKARYARNQNPVLLPLEATVDGANATLDALPRGARVVFRASWRPEDAEPYVALDVHGGGIVERRESLRVSWFATAGSFENDRTGRTETETSSFTDNAWTAPADAVRVHLWVVLRDARGGVAFATSELRTQ